MCCTYEGLSTAKNNINAGQSNRRGFFSENMSVFMQEIFFSFFFMIKQVYIPSINLFLPFCDTRLMLKIWWARGNCNANKPCSLRSIICKASHRINQSLNAQSYNSLTLSIKWSYVWISSMLTGIKKIFSLKRWRAVNPGAVSPPTVTDRATPGCC